MEKEETIASVLNKISESIGIISTKYGEEAAKTMLETASMMAQYEIIDAIFLLAISIPLFIYCLNIKIKNDIDEFFKTIGQIGGIVLSVIFFLISISTLTNPIIWKSMSEPKYYITYTILKKGLK